jgi:hypothetical protein
MTPFASVALFKRAGKLTFKPPRKERSDTATQARKSAIRFWRGNIGGDDVLTRVIVVREFGGMLEISERGGAVGAERPWTTHRIDLAIAAREPHLAACMREIAIDATDVQPPVPDVLVINGFTYRREI